MNKKPASYPAKKLVARIMKKLCATLARRPKKKNFKSNRMSRWLGTCVGPKKNVYMAANKKKNKITYRLLPSSIKAVKTSPRFRRDQIRHQNSRLPKVPTWCLVGGLHHARLSTRSATRTPHCSTMRSTFATRLFVSIQKRCWKQNKMLKKWSRTRYGKLQLKSSEVDA